MQGVSLFILAIEINCRFENRHRGINKCINSSSRDMEEEFFYAVMLGSIGTFAPSYDVRIAGALFGGFLI